MFHAQQCPTASSTAAVLVAGCSDATLTEAAAAGTCHVAHESGNPLYYSSLLTIPRARYFGRTSEPPMPVVTNVEIGA